MKAAFALSLVMFALPSVTQAEEWTELFNGKSLEGWTQRNGYASYAVEDGAIVGRTAVGSPNSFLCSLKRFGDFELEFEVKVDDGLNSGVQIRSRQVSKKQAEKVKQQAGRVFGPQVEIESGPAEAGYIYGEATGLGWLTSKEDLQPHDHFKNGEWNKFRVVAQGPRIQTFINDQQIADLTHEGVYKSHPKGFIGLQVHGIGKDKGPYEVRWKNIRIKSLD